MKRLFYILFAALFMVACTDEISVPETEGGEYDGKVTLTFGVSAPEAGVAQTRTLGEMTDDLQQSLSLWLMVYDEQGIFVQAAQATPGGNVAHGDHTDTQFTVTLNATSAKRVIHFIAFDEAVGSNNIASTISSLANQFGTETSMVAQQLFTSDGQAAYWHRLEVNGIKGATDADGNSQTPTTFECVPLVRNFAKISVSNGDTSNFTLEGFTVVNVPTRGSVAPYGSGSFVSFTNNNKEQLPYSTLQANYQGTSPAGVTFTNTASEATVTSSAPYYLYETPNASGNGIQGRTFLIVKGRFGSNTSTYYKVDLVYQDATDNVVFYNILRNIEYRVNIKEVLANGYSTLAEAASHAASNNLSASTATSSLTELYEGNQRINVSDTYYCFTSSGLQQVLKYKYEYTIDGGTSWITANHLVEFTNSNGLLFSAGPTLESTDDSDGYRTISMTLNNPTTEAMTSTIHIYASASKISDAGLTSTIAGELLSRNITVVLRNQYALLVDCPEYVPKSEGTAFTVNLLIAQGINDALFPLTFYIEPEEKTIYPDASSGVELPVHVGTNITNDSGQSSFQYTRIVTKDEYATLGTKTVGGVTYKVVPCYFKTSEDSSATSVYAANSVDLFKTTSGDFTNIPTAFSYDTSLTVINGTTTYLGTSYENSTLYGRNYPMPLTFNVTPEAVSAGTTFTITVTEGDNTFTDTYTPTSAGENVYVYYTQTMSASSISATITATYSPERGEESKTATLALNRQYFVIKANSFTTNISQCLDAGQTSDGSSIYVGGTYVGWFGRQFNGVEGHDPSEGYLGDSGPLADYIIDRSFQDYATVEDGMEVKFTIYNKTPYSTTTIRALDDARIAIESGGTSTLSLQFSE